MKFRRQWVDPAEGWKYGFPKIYDSEKDPPMRDWLLKQGYPEKMLEFPIRCWEAEEPKDDTD